MTIMVQSRLNSLAYSVANIKQFQDRMVLLPAIGGVD